ncbi:MAG: hypothetical protein ACLRWP_12620 [Bilophila wadsworthia]
MTSRTSWSSPTGRVLRHRPCEAPEAPADPNASHHIKVRVPTMKTQEALADGLGYQAPLPFAEFFTAAQTGMVSASSAAARKTTPPSGIC